MRITRRGYAVIVATGVILGGAYGHAVDARMDAAVSVPPIVAPHDGDVWTSPDAEDAGSLPGAAAQDGPWNAYRVTCPAGTYADHADRYAGYMTPADAGRYGFASTAPDASGRVYAWKLTDAGTGCPTDALTR